MRTLAGDLASLGVVVHEDESPRAAARRRANAVLRVASGCQSLSGLKRRLSELGATAEQARTVAADVDGDPSRFWGRLESVLGERKASRLDGEMLAVLANSGPRTLAKMGVDQLDECIRHPVLLAAVRDWHCGSMLLLGPTRAGKTVAAVALLRRWVERHHGSRAHAVWHSGDSLLMCERRHPLGQGVPPEYESAVAADLLVVDDPDWIRDRTADVLFSLVLAARERVGKPVIVTSGSTKAEFIERYGQAVYARVIESTRGSDGRGNGRVVDCHSGR